MICFLKMHGLGLHGLRCGWWTESCLSNVLNWHIFPNGVQFKKFGQDSLLMLFQHLRMWWCMVILRKEHLSFFSLLRGWRSRGRNMTTSCLDIQQRLKLLFQKHSEPLGSAYLSTVLGQRVSLWNFFRNFMFLLEHPRELWWFLDLVLVWPSLMVK